MYLNLLIKYTEKWAIKFWQVTFFYSAAKLLVLMEEICMLPWKKENKHQTNYFYVIKWKKPANSLLLYI